MRRALSFACDFGILQHRRYDEQTIQCHGTLATVVQFHHHVVILYLSVDSVGNVYVVGCMLIILVYLCMHESIIVFGKLEIMEMKFPCLQDTFGGGLFHFHYFKFFTRYAVRLHCHNAIAFTLPQVHNS
jgi:hypothetical protein